MNWLLLKNTLVVGAGATLLSVMFGLIAGLWLAGLPARARNAFLILAIIALALPPFLVTNCWLDLLGAAGVWHSWLPFNILSLAGAIWILSLLFWPIPLLAVWGAWRRLEPAQFEADPFLSGWALVRVLLLPLCRGALLQASILTLVLTLNNFAVPSILQVKILPAEMWIRFTTAFDSLGVLRMSWPLVIGPLFLLIWLTRRGIPWPHLQTSVSEKVFRRQLGKTWYSGFGVGAILLCLITVGLPLWQLASARRTWTELPGALAAGQNAVWNSLWFAAASATIILGLGLIFAMRRSRSTSGGSLKFFDGLLWLPFLLPGILLGVALIGVFNRPWSSLFYRSAGIVLLAFVIRYLALGWNTVLHATQMVDQDLLDVAQLEGATRWQMLRHVQWPQIRAQVLAAWYIVFLLCLWDVESMILVYPPGGETLALRIFNLLHYGHNAQVNALCLALLAVALLPLVLWHVARWLLHIVRLDFWRLSVRRTQPAIHTAVFVLGFLLLASGCCPAPSRLESKIFDHVEIIGTRGVGIGQLNKPRSLTVDRQENLYVVDMTGRVQKFTPSGQFVLFWQMPQTDLGKPKGMGRDREGNIIVVEPHYQRINFFSTEGNLLAQFGEKGTNAGQLIMPRAVAVNSQGEIFVSEYGQVERIQKFAPLAPLINTPLNGRDAVPGVPNLVPAEASAAVIKHPRLLSSFGRAGNGPGEFNRPEGLFIDTQDRLYVADSCNHRIQIFSSDGKFLRTYGRPGKGKGEFSYPYDICVDAAGRQYVCEFGNSRIQVFDANDHPLEIIGGVGADPGQFANPWSLALDSTGNLYIADSQNHRVQKLVRKPRISPSAHQSAPEISTTCINFSLLLPSLSLPPSDFIAE